MCPSSRSGNAVAPCTASTKDRGSGHSCAAYGAADTSGPHAMSLGDSGTVDYWEEAW